MNAVFFEVDSDAITKRVHQARRRVLSSTPAYPEYQLFGYNAFPSDVTSTHTKAGNFGLFSGMSHGGPDEFEGQSGITLYNSNSGSANYTVRGAIVHLYSCDCGQRLGPHLVRLGAKAFIGYSSPVSVPNVQSVVEEFVKVAAAIDQSILSGDSHHTTKRKADAEFGAVSTRLQAPGSTATPRHLAQFRMNHNAMVGPWQSNRYGAF